MGTLSLRTCVLFACSGRWSVGLETDKSPKKPGRHFYTIRASIDRYAAWKEAFFKKLETGEATPSTARSARKMIQSLAEHPGHAAEARRDILKIVESFEKLWKFLPSLPEGGAGAFGAIL